MDSPFPGMDPYLEHPALWPDVTNSLAVAIADALAPVVAARYYVALEIRAYFLAHDELSFVGRPEVGVVRAGALVAAATATPPASGVFPVDVPMLDEVEESYLEVREVRTGVLVTVIELLSPANKLHAEGRRQYEAKGLRVLGTLTHLVEIDLLRAGDPMPVSGPAVRSDYRILVSRGTQRPRALLHTFGLRDPIPTVPIPLLAGDPEPPLDRGAVVHGVYHRARFDLRLDYGAPPVPPLREDDDATLPSRPARRCADPQAATSDRRGRARRALRLRRVRQSAFAAERHARRSASGYGGRQRRWTIDRGWRAGRSAARHAAAQPFAVARRVPARN